MNIADNDIYEPSPEEIDACQDVAQLTRWYVEQDELSDEIRDQVDARRLMGDLASDDDTAWMRRTSKKVGHLKTSLRRMERRIIALGGTVPYSPADPRGKEIRRLQSRLEVFRKLLRDNGIPYPSFTAPLQEAACA